MASESLQKNKLIELLLISAVSLFCELLFIRWLSSDYRSLAVLKSLPLVTCFVGLGAGIAIARKAEFADKLFESFPFIFYLTIILIRVLALMGLSSIYLPSASLFQWTDVIKSLGKDFFSYQLMFMAFVTVLLAGPFLSSMAIGARIGRLFDELSQLPAYGANLSGALIASLLFTLCSYLCLPIWVLASIPAVLIGFWLLKQNGWPKWRTRILVILTIAAAAWPGRAPEGTQDFWSPYARITVFPVLAAEKVVPDGQLPADSSLIFDSSGEVMPASPARTSSFGAYNNSKKHEIGILLNVNQIFHQFFFPELELPSTWVPDPEISEVLDQRKVYYPAPYSLRPQYDDVLILGAGTGQDVKEAVKHGAKHVDAVEIDPLVVELGKKKNSTYALSNVQLVCDDARHFVSKTQNKYDLVLLACLDSSALTGLGSSVRLDSYMHTLESTVAVQKVLKPDGIFLMTFGSGGGDWLHNRVIGTTKEVFGYDPLVFEGANAFFVVAGEPVRRQELKMPDTMGADKKPAFKAITPGPADRLLTDDWPFLYMAPARFDWPLYSIFAELIIIALVSGRQLFFAKGEPKPWAMFFMGASFMLVELGAISRLCLLYTATWLTSAVVINAVLLMNTVATLMVIRKLPVLSKYVNVLFGLLVGLLAITYVVPSSVAIDSPLGSLAVPLITIVMVLPCLASGIIFAVLFAREANAPKALAFNIYGAVLGSLLEYVSNFFGLRSLALVAIVLYVLAWISMPKAESKSEA